MRSYVAAILVVILCTALNWPLSLWLAPTNLAMVYVLGVVAIAARYERGPAMTCALLSVLAFDFFFVPPVLTLRIDDTQYVVTGFALLVVGVVISTLAARARAASQAACSRARSNCAIRCLHLCHMTCARRWPSLPQCEQLARRTGTAVAGRTGSTVGYALRRGPASQSHRQRSARNDPSAQWPGRARSPVVSGEELVGAAIERSKRQLAQHRVQTRLDPQLPLLHVDGVLIEKLLVNLLENAAKYTPAGTLVTVVGENAPARSSCASRRRSGPAERRRGTHFRQVLPRRREAAVTGSGLGLSICRAIAQMHGGSIAAANRSGGGAVFTLKLPVEPAPPAAPP
jgi:two-component system sensor histidine kinase KdpD